MLRGFAIISYWADDLEAAKNGTRTCWASSRTSSGRRRAPPAYLELRVGDYQDELGIDRRYAPEGAASGPGGVVMYWHVHDVTATFERLLSMGVKEYQPITQPITQRGEAGWITASVVDPFGNVLGIIYNPHYLETLAALKGS